MRFLYFVLNYFFKFRIDIIIAKMLFDIIHRMISKRNTFSDRKSVV